MDEQVSGTTRRTVLKGAAWSVPVIAAAVATPLAAATGSPDPNEELYFYITAAEVIGQGVSSGEVRSNGVRISPQDPANPKTVAAGTRFVVTVSYHGDDPDFSFLNAQYGVDWNKQQNPAWPIITVTANQIIFEHITAYPTTEPTAGSISWRLDPQVRPANGSIVFIGVAHIAPGGDFPDGGTMSPLIIDPNAGTGSLSGPTDASWPLA